MRPYDWPGAHVAACVILGTNLGRHCPRTGSATRAPSAAQIPNPFLSASYTRKHFGIDRAIAEGERG